MLLTDALLRQAEERLGTPRRIELQASLDERETELVAHSLVRGRVHDVTMPIFDGDDVAVVRKPFFPADVFRAPSGGLHPGEDLEAAAVREGLEETGLDIEVERYLVRVAATFVPSPEWQGWESLPGEVLDAGRLGRFVWQSHVVLAHPTVRRPVVPIDTREIAEGRWVTLAELQGPIREALLRTGRPLLRYRVELTDAAVEELTDRRRTGDETVRRVTSAPVRPAATMGRS